MKKLLGILLVAVMAVGLMACGTKEGDNTTSNKKTQNIVKDGTQENDKGGASESVDMTYGKVTSIIGNEIELKLGTPPDIEEEADNEEAPPAGGGAMTTAPATEIAEGEFELDYTGKTLKVTVTSGIKIINMGETGSLENIKEGTFIGMTLDDPDAENPQVQQIQILN